MLKVLLGSKQGRPTGLGGQVYAAEEGQEILQEERSWGWNHSGQGLCLVTFGFVYFFGLRTQYAI